MMGPYSIKEGYIFREKETSPGKKCIDGMFILSFNRTYKEILNKKIVNSGGVHR